MIDTTKSFNDAFTDTDRNEELCLECLNVASCLQLTLTKLHTGQVTVTQVWPILASMLAGELLVETLKQPNYRSQLEYISISIHAIKVKLSITYPEVMQLICAKTNVNYDRLIAEGRLFFEVPSNFDIAREEVVSFGN